MLERLFPFKGFERYFLFKGCTVAASLVDFGYIDERVVFGAYSRLIRFFRKLSRISSVS